MTIETNKSIARQFIDYLRAQDFEGVTSLMSDDMTWWDVMRGTLSNADYLDAAKKFGEFYQTPIQLTIHGMTAEEDRVAIELESYVKMKKDLIYNNTYHILLTLKDGKITSVREYLNTKHVMDIVSQLY
jgi:ketosteroid isomerase-like protein